MLRRYNQVSDVSAGRNLLLRRLAPADAGMLLPHFDRVDIRSGERLFRASERIDTVYFPEVGLASLEERIGPRHVEAAVVGSEGMLGWPALMGCASSAHAVVVEGQGACALAIPFEPLLAACRSSPELWTTLLRFVQTVMAQMAQTIASQIECSLEQRIARWVLMRHDRVAGDQVLIRHDEIAGALSARRARSADRLHILEGLCLIRCRRGRIVVRDRAALEVFAGAAYGTAELRYRELLGPFGKAATRDFPAACIATPTPYGHGTSARVVRAA